MFQSKSASGRGGKHTWQLPSLSWDNGRFFMGEKGAKQLGSKLQQMEGSKFGGDNQKMDENGGAASRKLRMAGVNQRFLENQS